MKSSYDLMKKVRVVFFYIISTIILASAHETPDKANEILKTWDDVFSQVQNTVTPSESFPKLSRFLVDLSAAAMPVAVSITLPGGETTELQAFHGEFEKFNNKLDSLTSKLGVLENIKEFSDDKSGFLESMKAIVSNFAAVQKARKWDDIERFSDFARHFEKTFSQATEKIFASLIGSQGFDVVNLMKIKAKCNPQFINDFCVKGLQLIGKGIFVEAAYHGYNNDSALDPSVAEHWNERMEQLGKHCSYIISDCEKDWRKYAYIQFKDTYREIGGDNQAFAERLAKDMDNVVPQRNWLTVVYNDALGFGPHTFSSYYEVEKIWHELDHCATVASIEKNPALTGQDLDELKQQIQTQVAIAESVTDCRKLIYWIIPTNRYKDNHARFIVERIRDTFHTGFVNAVNVDYKPGVKATGSTLYVTEVKWRCTSSPFKLIIFQ